MSTKDSDADSSTFEEGKKRKERSPPEFAHRSKKTFRSPIKVTNKTVEAEEKEMEELKIMMQTIINSNDEIKKQLKDLKENQQKYQEEMKELKEENKKLKEKLNKLERNMETKEKWEKRNNIVITGAEITQDNIEENVQLFLEEELGVRVKITRATSIKTKEGKNLVIATVNNMEGKTEIMKNKNKLKGQDKYIDNDLTAKERGIQRHLRNIAKDMRIKGKNKVKVAYKKIIQGDKILMWNEISEELEELVGNDKTSEEGSGSKN